MGYRALGRSSLGALAAAAPQATYTMRQVGAFSIRFLDDQFSGEALGSISAADVQAAFEMPPGADPSQAILRDADDPRANVFALQNGQGGAGPFVQKALAAHKALVMVDPASIGQEGLAQSIVLVTNDPELAARATDAGPTNAVINISSDVRWSGGGVDRTAFYVGVGALGALGLAGILFIATRKR